MKALRCILLVAVLCSGCEEIALTPNRKVGTKDDFDNRRNGECGNMETQETQETTP